MWRKNFSALTAAAVCLCLAAPARPASAQGPRPDELIIAGNQTFALELLSPISTATNKKGDKFECKVLSPVEYSGALVSGHISKVKSSGKADKNSELDMSFDTITLTDGVRGKFAGHVKEVNDVAGAASDGRADIEGTVKGKSRVKTSIKRAAIGALIGGIAGGVLAGPKGAAAGAAIGASVGVTTVLATKGPNLEFASGTQFTVVTDGPREGRRPRPRQPAPEIAAAPASNAAPARAAPAARVAGPSAARRTFRNSLVTLSVPDNWRESQSGQITMFAPDGAHVQVPRPGYTHVVMLGSLQAGRMTLEQATDQLVATLIKLNPYHKRLGTHARVRIAGGEGLAVFLSGVWPQTSHVEETTVYTTRLPNGNLFYLIAVSPQAESATYGPLFNDIVRSVEFAR